MKFLGFNITRGGVESETFQAFSSPFRKVGDANLSLPKIDGRFTQAGGFVPFGTDNLYPQLINQLYYTSPLHAAIVDFKVNATLGGGYKWSTDGLSSLQEVELYAFESKIKGSRGVKSILYDLILHNRVYFTGRKDKKGKVILRQRVCPSKVRKDNTGEIYFTCDDWATRINVKQYKPFSEAKNGEEFMWAYEVESVGQDIYSLPSYTSANNWVFLDGEMSYLQKSNILNSVFPSFAMLFPKKPQSDEEKKMIKDSMSNLKGAENAGKAAAFFANGKEYLPSIEALPTNSNDGLFQQTTESIDSKICQAHTIDPILMGIRVSGKLGSGTDIKQAYIIFEKNVIMPLREELEYIVNSLVSLNSLGSNMFTVNDYQIVNETIIEVEDDNGGKTNEALNAMSPLVATKVLESMTSNEIRALAGLTAREGGDSTGQERETVTETVTDDVVLNDSLKGLSPQENSDIFRIVRDFKKGKLNEAIARTRLAAYGFDAETIKEILEL